MRNTGGCAAALALMVFATGARAGSAVEVLYERSLMSAAGERCHLFTPTVAAALAAASRQARGAALRAGTDAGQVDAAATRARDRALGLACNSKDLAVAADRVRTAFAGYAKIDRMSFPGTLGAWQADRSKTAAGVPAGARWRLSQAARGAAATLGVASDGLGLTAVVATPQAAAASSARLVMRDPSLAPLPFIDPRRNDLAGRIAPRSDSAVFLASARGPAPAGLLPANAPAGGAFRFPAAAAAALDALDPREAVSLELVYSGRDGSERVQTVLFEVGDFAAGRAFLAAR